MSENALELNSNEVAVQDNLDRAAAWFKSQPDAIKINPLTRHFISNPKCHNGVYGREMKLKAGNLIMGKIHKYEQLNILAEGEAIVYSIDGEARIKAPYVFIGSAGAERVIFAVTDLTWITAHAIGKKIEIEEIENELVEERKV